MRISDWSSDVCSSDLVIQDSTLISFLPTADMAEIIAEATNAVAESLPFDSSMVISPQGGIKLSGATPTWKGAIRLVEAALERSVGRRLFSVKNRDLKANKAEFEEVRSEEHTSELQSLMRISYAVFCLKKKKKKKQEKTNQIY